MSFSAKKHFGLHFLKDPKIAKKIVNYLNLNESNHVIEIGPGKVLSGLIARITTGKLGFK